MKRKQPWPSYCVAMSRGLGRHDGGSLPWKKRPRYPLSWNYSHRIYLFVLLVIFGLIWGGFAALSGIDRRGNPLLGALALLGGIALLALLFVYLRRPTKPLPKMPTMREDLADLGTSIGRLLSRTGNPPR